MWVCCIHNLDCIHLGDSKLLGYYVRFDKLLFLCIMSSRAFAQSAKRGAWCRQGRLITQWIFSKHYAQIGLRSWVLIAMPISSDLYRQCISLTINRSAQNSIASRTHTNFPNFLGAEVFGIPSTTIHILKRTRTDLWSLMICQAGQPQVPRQLPSFLRPNWVFSGWMSWKLSRCLSHPIQFGRKLWNTVGSDLVVWREEFWCGGYSIS